MRAAIRAPTTAAQGATMQPPARRAGPSTATARSDCLGSTRTPDRSGPIQRIQSPHTKNSKVAILCARIVHDSSLKIIIFSPTAKTINLACAGHTRETKILTSLPINRVNKFSGSNLEHVTSVYFNANQSR